MNELSNNYQQNITTTAATTTTVIGNLTPIPSNLTASVTNEPSKKRFYFSPLFILRRSASSNNVRDTSITSNAMHNTYTDTNRNNRTNRASNRHRRYRHRQLFDLRRTSSATTRTSPTIASPTVDFSLNPTTATSPTTRTATCNSVYHRGQALPFWRWKSKRLQSCQTTETALIKVDKEKSYDIDTVWDWICGCTTVSPSLSFDDHVGNVRSDGQYHSTSTDYSATINPLTTRTKLNDDCCDCSCCPADIVPKILAFAGGPRFVLQRQQQLQEILLELNSPAPFHREDDHHFQPNASSSELHFGSESTNKTTQIQQRKLQRRMSLQSKRHHELEFWTKALRFDSTMWKAWCLEFQKVSLTSVSSSPSSMLHPNLEQMNHDDDYHQTTEDFLSSSSIRDLTTKEGGFYFGDHTLGNTTRYCFQQPSDVDDKDNKCNNSIYLFSSVNIQGNNPNKCDGSGSRNSSECPNVHSHRHHQCVCTALPFLSWKDRYFLNPFVPMDFDFVDDAIEYSKHVVQKYILHCDLIVKETKQKQLQYFQMQQSLVCSSNYDDDENNKDIHKYRHNIHHRSNLDPIVTSTTQIASTLARTTSACFPSSLVNYDLTGTTTRDNITDGIKNKDCTEIDDLKDFSSKASNHSCDSTLHPSDYGAVGSNNNTGSGQTFATNITCDRNQCHYSNTLRFRIRIICEPGVHYILSPIQVPINKYITSVSIETKNPVLTDHQNPLGRTIHSYYRDLSYSGNLYQNYGSGESQDDEEDEVVPSELRGMAIFKSGSSALSSISTFQNNGKKRIFYNDPLFHVSQGGHLHLKSVSLQHQSHGSDIWNGNSAIYVRSCRSNVSSTNENGYDENEDSNTNYYHESLSSLYTILDLDTVHITSKSGRGIVAIPRQPDRQEEVQRDVTTNTMTSIPLTFLNITNSCIEKCAATGVYIAGGIEDNGADDLLENDHRSNPGSLATVLQPSVQCRIINSDIVANGQGSGSLRPLHHGGVGGVTWGHSGLYLERGSQLSSLTNCNISYNTTSGICFFFANEPSSELRLLASLSSVSDPSSSIRCLVNNVSRRQQHIFPNQYQIPQNHRNVDTNQIGNNNTIFFGMTDTTLFHNKSEQIQVTATDGGVRVNPYNVNAVPSTLTTVGPELLFDHRSIIDRLKLFLLQPSLGMGNQSTPNSNVSFIGLPQPRSTILLRRHLRQDHLPWLELNSTSTSALQTNTPDLFGRRR